MPKESRVEIPSGSGNFYRYAYDPETQATRYLGTVGQAPEMGEEEFLAEMDDNEDKSDEWYEKNMNWSKGLTEEGIKHIEGDADAYKWEMIGAILGEIETASDARKLVETWAWRGSNLEALAEGDFDEEEWREDINANSLEKDLGGLEDNLRESQGDTILDVYKGFLSPIITEREFHYLRNDIFQGELDSITSSRRPYYKNRVDNPDLAHYELAAIVMQMRSEPREKFTG